MKKNSQSKTRPIPSEAELRKLGQRRRNRVLLMVLLGLVALIFAISLVQFGRAGHLG
ncbi:MAG: hypothetical protein QM523_04075 [Candidatus Pacebacteria bacterium]|nr:hypothetical protein [Candidatus Paceibacterota bacterium]